MRRTPTPDAARTSPKFISHVDAEGGASWDEEFFFGRVSGEIAVRIVCIDKVPSAALRVFLSGRMFSIKCQPGFVFCGSLFVLFRFTEERVEVDMCWMSLGLC